MYCSSEIDRKYFIDNKIQGKTFSWIHDFFEIFLPQYILLVIIHARSCYCGEALDRSKNY